MQFHELTARAIAQACTSDFTARYLISLPRWAPLECYQLAQRLLDENEDLVPHDSRPRLLPLLKKAIRPPVPALFFRRLRRDNELRPERALDVAYHVGEVYFDKSLESAVRWCPRSRGVGCAALGALHLR